MVSLKSTECLFVWKRKMFSKGEDCVIFCFPDTDKRCFVEKQQLVVPYGSF